MTYLEIYNRDFPGGTLVKNPPANAGDMGSSPGPGRSHMPRSNKVHEPQLLSLHSIAREPQLLRPVRSRACMPQLLSLRAAPTETCHVPRACAPQREKPLQWEAVHHNEDPQPKINKII